MKDAAMKDAVSPVISPAFPMYVAVGLIAFFCLLGLRYAWRAFLLRFVFNKPYNDPKFEALSDKLPPDRSGWKAIACFLCALVLAWVFLSGSHF